VQDLEKSAAVRDEGTPPARFAAARIARQPSPQADDPPESSRADAPGPAGAAARAALAAATVVVALLVAVRLVAGSGSYLLFHTLAETFAVAVASAVFMLAFNARLAPKGGFLLVLGAAYLPVAVLDLLHAISYQGVGILPIDGPNLATQLWISARYIEALALAIAPFALRTAPRPRLVLLGWSLIGGVLLVLIFSGRFPDSFVPGQGLTTFKIVSEYVIAGVLLGTLYTMHRRRHLLAPEPYFLVQAAIGVTVAAELLFTLYQDPYGATNQLGHVLKVVSYYLVYRAVFEVGLRDPFALLLREVEEQRHELEASNAELELYARTVSHDLRSPLSAVTSAIDLMRAAAEKPDAPRATSERALAVIERNVQAALRLVDDVLRLAKAGSRGELVEDVDVTAVVARIVAERSVELTNAGLRVEADTDLGVLEAAPAHVYQVFSNLVNNAIAHAGGRATSIEIRKLPSRRRQSRYLVRDDGPGIPEQHLESIFSPFFSGRPGGTGIGLAIVQRIVGRYGGEIRAYNDGGACFELVLRAPR
jgi:signal transduction histidine kinase